MRRATWGKSLKLRGCHPATERGKAECGLRLSHRGLTAMSRPRRRFWDPHAAAPLHSRSHPSRLREGAVRGVRHRRGAAPRFHCLDPLSRLQPGHRLHRRRAAGSEIGAGDRHRFDAFGGEQPRIQGFPIQYFGGGECDKPVDSCVLIRVQPKDHQDAQAAVASMKQKLGKGYDYRRADIVGPKVSQELFQDGVMAMLLAVVMIAIYVSVRFEWQYGIGAAFATGHDVLVTAGLFSLLHLDFTLESVAALLTLAGYSINDTVVVFD